MTVPLSECQANRLLAALSRPDIERWLPHLDRLDVAAGTVLVPARERPSHVFFPTTAVVSLDHAMPGGACVEIAVIGREGFVGVPIVLGGDAAPDRATVRVAGRVLRLPARLVEAEMEKGGAVLRHMLRFASALLVQVSHTAIRDRHCSTWDA